MTLARQALAEGLGTGMLVMAIVGSGIMAEKLAGTNAALSLMANTGAVVASLAVLISLFDPVSGAHFNPLVTLVARLRGALTSLRAVAYCIAQFAGAISGTVVAHAMFSHTLFETGDQQRSGTGIWLSEFVATAGLLLVVCGLRRREDAPWMIAGWIGAAYWCTSSTSFANPAVTVARALTNTFAGISPDSVPAFLVAQLTGAVCACFLTRILRMGR